MRFFDVFPCNPRLYVLVLVLLLGAPTTRAQAPSQKPLDIYFIDVEGGQATLFVAPSGESNGIGDFKRTKAPLASASPRMRP